MMANIIRQYSEMAAHLWLIRDRAVHAPHYDLKDLAKLEALFFKELERHNRTPIPAARKQAVAEPYFPK